MPTFKYLFLVLLVSCWATAYAAVPSSLTYQGYLSDAGGSAVEGSVVVTFSIYTAEFGGVALWSDTQLLALDQGLFSVDLGRLASPFPAGLFNTPLWLGVAVDPDAEMLPRRPLTTVGFAFKADDALSLQGQGPAAFDQAAHVTDTGNPHGVTSAQTGAASNSDIANLQSQLDAALASITQLQINLSNETTARIAADDAEETTRIANDNTEASARVAADNLHDLAISGIQANTVLTLDGVLTFSGGDTALFDGVNVQVVNGTGTTDGMPNGIGNVIVGYDAVDTDSAICSLGAFVNIATCQDNGGIWAASHKSGSHNLIIGDKHNYSRFGGLVVGLDNNITGDWSSASAGSNNTASGNLSSVSGGASNKANGLNTSVSGGVSNTASGFRASISGGVGNTANGDASSISGGQSNSSSGDVSSISGGQSNTASFPWSSVSSGQDNTASGSWSSVSGGNSNVASGDWSSVSGGFFNSASGDNASVSGGHDNTASDTYASVSGGIDNTASGSSSSISGGQRNFASGVFSSVSGGFDNTASGETSSILGGKSNTASGIIASVSGGDDNTASNNFASVSGGKSNTAFGESSSVSGGQGNFASGLYSSVTGGMDNNASGENASVSGGIFNNASGVRSSITGGDAVLCSFTNTTCGEGTISAPD